MLVQVIAAHSLQVREPADDLVAIGVDLERGALYLLGQQERGAILVHAALGDNHCALPLHLLGVEETVHHAVRLDVQGQFHPIGGQRLKVGCVVEPGHGVEDAALAGEQAVIGPRGIFGRSLELHVFHPVGDARFPRHLIATAHSIPHPGTDYRRGVHLLQDNGQAIRQLGACNVADHGQGWNARVRYSAIRLHTHTHTLLWRI